MGWVETRRVTRYKTVFGNHRTETQVILPPKRNTSRRTRQRGSVTITEEWRELPPGYGLRQPQQRELAGAELAARQARWQTRRARPAERNLRHHPRRRGHAGPRRPQLPRRQHRPDPQGRA